MEAADVLFARLQGERETGLALEVDGATHDAARHLPHPFLPAAHETEIRPAGGQRRAERLPFAAGNVGASLTPFTRRRQQREGGGNHHADPLYAVGMRSIR